VFFPRINFDTGVTVKIEYEREEDKFIFLSLGNIQLMLEEGSEEELSQMEYPFGKGQ